MITDPLTAVQLATDVDFDVFQRRKQWPQAKDLIFIADAIDRLADAIWASEDHDLDVIRREIGTQEEPPERSGILWSMVKLLEPMLVNGALTTHVRAVNGSGTGPLRDYEWDSDHAIAAIARGVIGIKGDDGVVRDHWVFLDQVEYDLLELIYSPAGFPPEAAYDNLKLRHERMFVLVRDNISAIAKSRQAGLPTRFGAGAVRTVLEDDPTPSEFDWMFADARRLLEARHQIALEQRMAGWLVARFDDDQRQTWKRAQFKKLARTSFAPYYSDDYFGRAWTTAIAARPHRFKAGRPPKAASS